MKLLPILMVALFLAFITISWNIETINLKPVKTWEPQINWNFDWLFGRSQPVYEQPETEPVNFHFTFLRYIFDP